MLKVSDRVPPILIVVPVRIRPLPGEGIDPVGPCGPGKPSRPSLPCAPLRESKKSCSSNTLGSNPLTSIHV